ncbi:MAG TPA: 50S ribosomal protein L31 [Candidatus Pacearchaeota archaeon]|nr:50S ribosomal protein L31 [Candidatus Pacearchaeota archaeon]
MKKEIHPKYYPEARVTCACGKKFTVGSTSESIRTEVCGFCHPFYTGEQKFIDAQGQVQKFQSRVAKAKKMKTKK